MKNKKRKLLSLLLVCVAAVSIVGCGEEGANSSSSINSASEGDVIASKKVDEQGFKEGIEKLLAAEKYTATIDGEMQDGTAVTIKRDGNLVYVSPVYIDETKGAQTAYFQYDDDALTETAYIHYANAPDEWTKQTYTAPNEESYAQTKSAMGLADNVGLSYLYATSEGEAAVEISELYSAFAFEEETKKYTASVYMCERSWGEGGDQPTYEYMQVNVAFSFDEGNVVGFTLSLGALSLAATISYEATVIIPAGALNAQE